MFSAWTCKILIFSINVQLVDAFALSLGALQQQMFHAVQEKDIDPDRDPDISMLIE